MTTITKERLSYIASVAKTARDNALIKNPIDIAIANGISISFVDLDNELPAFADLKSRIIYISKYADNYSRQILCAHEMGHILLQKDNSVSLFDETLDSINEFEANLFLYYIYPKVFSRMNYSMIHSIEDFNHYVVRQIRFCI